MGMMGLLTPNASILDRHWATPSSGFFRRKSSDLAAMAIGARDDAFRIAVELSASQVHPARPAGSPSTLQGSDPESAAEVALVDEAAVHCDVDQSRALADHSAREPEADGELVSVGRQPVAALESA